ncbi:phasin family protein [Rhizobium tumorigenes]|uniref:Phasin family protein n=1 Tax=Rhizobium tumorigenes TaxID=2041385 RepID=A0AAF1KIE2_9HYPH|nr:phasin family protein [Rhizobium tumorigenes]WFR96693.1 phasin family protein [Rhizobium tumorigenes]
MMNDKQNAVPDTDAIDEALRNYTQAAMSVQAIAAEAAGYSKKSFEDAVSHVGTLSSVTSLDAALELQSNFAKSTYEGFVAEAAKIGEMYAGLAKSVYDPARKAAARSSGNVGDSANGGA